jgi:hypothetical protein
MTARGGGAYPYATELRNMGPRGAPTYPLGIAERWHRNLPSLKKERNPATWDYYTLPAPQINPPTVRRASHLHA